MAVNQHALSRIFLDNGALFCLVRIYFATKMALICVDVNYMCLKGALKVAIRWLTGKNYTV